MRFPTFAVIPLDGPATPRAWTIALTIVILQATAIAWGFAVLR
jgi:hypothetical protein